MRVVGPVLILVVIIITCTFLEINSVQNVISQTTPTRSQLIFPQNTTTTASTLPQTETAVNHTDIECSSEGRPSSFVVNTHQGTYTEGQVPQLYVSVYDKLGCIVNKEVTVRIIYHDTNPKSNKTIYQETAF